MNMKTVMAVMITVGLLVLNVGALAQSGNDLFQQALVKDRTEGNLPEAIKLYQTIVQKFGSDRKLAAKALFQMGQAYEKLGNPEARHAYERIAIDFGDQKEVAANAGRRLAVLTAPPSPDKPTLRIVKTSENSDESVNFDRRWMSISLDGRWMAVTRWSAAGNELAVQDMSTGQLKRLQVGSCEARQYSVPRAGPPCTVSALPTLSPDSRQIVYTWHDPADVVGQGQLRVVANE